MINLIPDETKQNNHYAIRNNRLVRYAIVSGASMVAIILITGFTIFTMSKNQTSLNNELSLQSQQITTKKAVETNAQKLSEQINTIKELLKRQVKFSERLPDIAKVLPNGAILLQLDFDVSDLGSSTTSAAAQSTTAKALEKPFVIRAATTSPEVATILLENIRARTDLFKSADIIERTYSPASEGTGNSGGGADGNVLTQKYPYQVVINAYFNSAATATKGASTEKK